MASYTSTTSSTRTRRPVSSSASRAAAARAVSPGSILPPGKLHRPRFGSRARCTSSTRFPSRHTTAAPGTARSIASGIAVLSGAAPVLRQELPAERQEPVLPERLPDSRHQAPVERDVVIREDPGRQDLVGLVEVPDVRGRVAPAAPPGAVRVHRAEVVDELRVLDVQPAQRRVGASVAP